MNAADRPPRLLATGVAPPLRSIALAALAEPAADGAEAAWMREQAALAGDATLADWQRAPPPEDARLHALARAFGLGDAELIALALAAAVESDPMLCRVLAWLQAPTGVRPTVALVLTLAEELGLPGAFEALVDGPARGCGLLLFDDEKRPLPEATLQMPVPIVLALRGAGGNWPGVRLDDAPPPAAAPSLREAAARQAAALHDASAGGGMAPLLAVRSGHPREARAAAALVAGELGGVAAFIDGDPPRGLAPWLWLRGAVPVLCIEIAPGETRRLTGLPGHRGPLLLATGIDGSFEHDGDPVGSWRVELPLPAERVALWAAHLPADAAERLGRGHRHAPACIEHLTRTARRHARLAGDAALDEHHVRVATRQGAAGELGTLAQLLPDAVPDEALVMPPELQASLAALRSRCGRREGLADALGPSARTRYRPGVRALLVGASGTGKTLAAAWLASRLGLPLYRVDLASVASKYIGETEKNLAQLFARAEQAEVVLLFDEADSLFGRRTEVKDANDRFANQQTNYLLQRIESFDGIALLTSNSRARFDSAFTRRLDAIIDFPVPGPAERRVLWLAHLGTHHLLETAQLNRIAATCDLAGGHIRNATLAATACSDGPIGYDGLRAAIDAEYRKLGRQSPAGL